MPELALRKTQMGYSSGTRVTLTYRYSKELWVVATINGQELEVFPDELVELRERTTYVPAKPRRVRRAEMLRARQFMGQMIKQVATEGVES